MRKEINTLRLARENIYEQIALTSETAEKKRLLQELKRLEYKEIQLRDQLARLELN